MEIISAWKLVFLAETQIDPKKQWFLYFSQISKQSLSLFILQPGSVRLVQTEKISSKISGHGYNAQIIILI